MAILVDYADTLCFVKSRAQERKAQDYYNICFYSLRIVNIYVKRLWHIAKHSY